MSKSQLFRLRIQKANGELELPWALQDWSYEAMKKNQSNLDALAEKEPQ